MTEAEFGNVDIDVSIIGYNTEANSAIFRLPAGTLVHGKFSKTVFEKQIMPLIKNPPPKQVRQAPVQSFTIVDPNEQIEKPKVLDDLWWDVEAMFHYIREHATQERCHILCDDRPSTLNVMAWKCAGECKGERVSWSVGINIFKQHLDKMANSSDETLKSQAFNLRKCIISSDGRQRLCDSFNKGIG
jgi:hypothetical protein